MDYWWAWILLSAVIGGLIGSGLVMLIRGGRGDLPDLDADEDDYQPTEAAMQYRDEFMHEFRMRKQDEANRVADERVASHMDRMHADKGETAAVSFNERKPRIIGSVFPGGAISRVLGKSQGYYGLPIRDEVVNDSVTGPNTPVMVTAWFPTPDELEAMNSGAPIHLTIVGRGHPPVMLSVGDVPE